ncbi:hypothetical protein [Rhodobacteraceae bacterium DSL-40]|uniref:hypothetical protein n=1 Tax=Amaricoccus sp. B4 TaxID=3368557 RepID=UPI000DACC7DF
MIRTFCVFLVALSLLHGCGAPTTTYGAYTAGRPMPMFYKGGAAFSEISVDNTECQVEATQRVPAQIQYSQTPAYTTPASVTCNQYGTQTFCNQTGGQTYGGEMQSYDANAGLRQQVHLQCMARKGYQLVNLPACPAGVDISDQDDERVLRPLSATSCYQADPSNRVRIGNY